MEERVGWNSARDSTTSAMPSELGSVSNGRLGSSFSSPAGPSPRHFCAKIPTTQRMPLSSLSTGTLVSQQVGWFFAAQAVQSSPV